MQTILLHVCCAVCLGHPVNLLQKENYKPIIFFFNPNIYPVEEYNRRLNELIHFCKKENVELVLTDYEPDLWYENIKGLELEPEKGLRCNKCFELRLKKTAEKCKELGINDFTTTLTVSPHKVSKNIFAIGQKIAKDNGLNFLEFDFKKQNGFLKTMEIAKQNKFYRQNYCGCEYSIKKNKTSETT